MTKYKVYRVNGNGFVTVEIVEAHNWNELLTLFQYSGDPIFKIEVYGGADPVEN